MINHTAGREHISLLRVWYVRGKYKVLSYGWVEGTGTLEATRFGHPCLVSTLKGMAWFSGKGAILTHWSQDSADMGNACGVFAHFSVVRGFIQSWLADTGTPFWPASERGAAERRGPREEGDQSHRKNRVKPQPQAEGESSPQSDTSCRPAGWVKLGMRREDGNFQVRKRQVKESDWKDNLVNSRARKG